MIIGIHNDGKCKHQSYEARLLKSELYMVGYGANKEDAIEELRIQIIGFKSELEQLDLNKTINTDCFGVEV